MWLSGRLRPLPGVVSVALLLLVAPASAASTHRTGQHQGRGQTGEAAPPRSGGGAPEGAGSRLTVPQAFIGTDVKDKEIVGAGSRFPSSVGRLFCLTRISGAPEPTKVTHRWFFGDRQVHKVDLQVNGTTWRTWSFKTIPPGWTGEWRVDVEDVNGTVIYSIPFTIGGAAAGGKSGSTGGEGGEETH
jgi:DUF2914 family protein